MSLYQERLDRIRAAVALEPVDRVPFSYLGSAVNVQFTGGNLARYCQDMKYNLEINLRGIEMAGEIDCTQTAVYRPDILSVLWLSEVALPGQGLPENELWQLRERELVTPEDYDKILAGGFGGWYNDFLKKKLGDPLKRLPGYVLAMWQAERAFAKKGIPSINRGGFYSPYEMFCGGRSSCPL